MKHVLDQLRNWMHTLSSKLVFLITVLFVIISLLLSIIGPKKLEHEQLRIINKKARSVSNMAAYSVRALLDFGFTEGIAESFAITQQNKDIAYIMLEDSSGHLVYAYNKSVAEQSDYRSSQYDGNVSDNEMILNLVTPIDKDNKHLGELYVGVSLRALRAEVSGIKRSIAAGSIMIILLGIAGAVFISRIVTAPIKKMAQAFDVIAQGDLKKRVQVSSKDEVGRLAESFNKMGNSLEAAYRALENTNSTLQTEISERIRTSEVLRESEERYRILVSELPDFVVVHIRGKIIFVNNVVKELLGYEPEEVLGTNIRDYVCEEYRDAVKESINRRLQNEKVDAYEMELLKASGERLIVETRGTVIKYGDETAVLNVLTNISERKEFEKALQKANEDLELRVSERTSELIEAIEQLQDQVQERRLAEKSLRVSEEKFRALSECSTDAIMRFDRDLRHLYVNKALEMNTGIPASSFIGKTHSDLNFPENLSRLFASTISSVFESKKPLRIDFEDNSGHWIDWSMAPEFSPDGEVQTVLVFARDISERKRFENEIIKAKEQALDASQMKSEFLANMSHEIRTPLNGVIGMTNLLLSTPLNAEQWEFVQIIQNSGDVLLNIINDILDFSKIEAGRLELEIISFNLRHIVEEAVEIFAHKAHEKKVDLLSIVYDECPQELEGDPGRLRQVLINLIGNAIKFTDSGEIVVQAKLESRTDDSVVILFSVDDTGIGINPDVREKLFRPFTQADGSTTRKYGGTGLGLSISKRLVEMMDGTIDLESSPGRGSRFFFTAVFKESISDDSAAAVDYNDRFTGSRILVVDDSQTNRKIIQHQTSLFGMRSVSAEDHKSASEQLYRSVVEKDPFSILILDMQIPGGDGLEFARKIKSDPDTAAIEIIALTTVAEVNKNLFKDNGISGYINKPVKQSALFDAIAHALGKPAGIIETGITNRQPENQIYSDIANLRILIAEDNTTNQKVAVHMLRKLGAQKIDVVANGLEAVSITRQFRYDIIFMDCQMPEMDGFEATESIREFQKEHKSYIVAMTANALQGDREKCFAAGMNDYIAKPVNPKVLESVILKYLKCGKTEPTDMLISDDNEVRQFVNAAQIELLKALGGETDPALINEFIDTFISDAPQILENIDQALQDANMREFKSAVHKLKGASGNIGAAYMQQLCIGIECSISRDDTESLRVQVEKLCEAFGLTERELNTYRV